MAVVGFGSTRELRSREERLADFLRDGPRPSTAPPRARSALQAYAVKNRLCNQVLLTYEELTPEPVMELRTLIKRSRRQAGPHPWVAVPEFGSAGRIHFHVGLPPTVDPTDFAAGWKHGFTDSVFLPTVADIKRYCGYLGKGFDEPRSKRPHNHRYIPAPGYKPAWIDHGYATRQDAEILAQQQAGERWTTVRRWEAKSDWCTGGFEWDVEPPSPGGLVEAEEDFFRRIGATPCDQLL